MNQTIFTLCMEIYMNKLYKVFNIEIKLLNSLKVKNTLKTKKSKSK